MREFTVQSHLAVDPATFWANVSLETVNWELRPFVRMTAPAAWRNRPLARWPIGDAPFKSWILLLGVIPVDRHAFRLDAIYEGAGFQERSSSWLNRQWNHKRTTEADLDGCILTDHVAVVGRFPLLTALFMPIYRSIFRHRHRRLRRKYATGDG